METRTRGIAPAAVVSNRGYLRQTGDGVFLNLRVSPGAKKTSVTGLYGESALRMKVSAPPADGKANAEIEDFLSEVFGIPRSHISIAKGASSRDKVVLIENTDIMETHRILASRISQK